MSYILSNIFKYTSIEKYKILILEELLWNVNSIIDYFLQNIIYVASGNFQCDL